MDFELLSFLALLLVTFYIYKEIYSFYTNREKSKYSIGLVSVASSLVLAFVVYNLLIWSNFELEYSKNILTTVITIAMWAGAYIFKNIDMPSIFSSSKIEGNGITAALGYRKYKRVSDFTSKQIPFYVRFTVYELDGNNEKMVFDSSDYTVINKTFGAYEDIQQSFLQGDDIEFKGKIYSTEFVKVDFVSIIDDYHMGHSAVYEGIDTPYNIQIFIKIKGKNN